MTKEYKSSYSGAQMNNALTLSNSALQNDAIVDESGSTTNKAISQNKATNLSRSILLGTQEIAIANNVVGTIANIPLRNILDTNGTTLLQTTNTTNITGVIGSNAIATNQTKGDSSTKVANTAFTTSAINDLLEIDTPITISSALTVTNVVVKQCTRCVNLVCGEICFQTANRSTASNETVTIGQITTNKPKSSVGVFVCGASISETLNANNWKSKIALITSSESNIITMHTGTIDTDGNISFTFGGITTKNLNVFACTFAYEITAS